MKQNSRIRASIALVAVALATAQLSADVVETKNGARIVGKVTKIDGGSVFVSTDYAGAITIKQSEVAAINTDAPVAVRLANGTRIDGKVSGAAGSLQVAGADGTISTSVDKVAASWAAGGRDPQITALERGWVYEAAVDVTGKSGNKSQLGTAANLRATLAGAKVVNSLTVVPSFNEFSNYRATHASYFEMPLASPAWKLRVGLANDYNSLPPKEVEKMDTSYFTRLVLNWK